MKKTIVSLAVLLSAATISQAQFKLGPVLGGNLSHPYVMTNGQKFDYTQWHPGFYVGGVAEVAISQYLSIQSGIDLSLKRWYAKDGNGSNATLDVTPYFIEVPVSLVAKIPLGNGYELFSLGPCFSYGIAGKIKTGSNYYPNAEDKILWGNDSRQDTFKPFDVGLNLGVGYELSNGLFINGGYQLGLSNLVPGGGSDNKYKNNVFKLGLGYLFTLHHAPKKVEPKKA